MSVLNFSTQRINLLIILISTVMMVVVLNLPFKAKPFGDITFHEEAKNLALYLKGDIGFDKVTITKAPGPVIFYTPAYFAAPAHATDNQLWTYGVVFTFVITTISLLLVFKIATAFFSKEVGLLSVLLFFVFPIHCYYSLGILAEAPAFFSLALALYGWSVAYYHPHKIKGWLWLTVGIWFLILNRPNAVFLLGLGIVVVAFAFWRNKSFFWLYGKKIIITCVTVGLLGFTVLQLAKTITGTKAGGNQEELFYFVAHQGRFQFREEPTDFRFWDNEIRPDSKDYQNWVRSISDLDRQMIATGKSHNQVYQEFLLDDIAEHPFWFTRQFFVKSFYGHVYFINSVKPNEFKLGPLQGAMGYWFFILLINAINVIILLGAFLFLFKEKQLIRYWPFWGVIVALLIFHALTYMEPRYMFPARVALYIMSAAGLYKIGFIKRVVNFIAKFVFPLPKATANEY
ncbi:glycosyltransferase family protein [Flavobacterium sedimenticola]|uniref:Glycosyltransferase family 39 protein n=1 Tax=Flavobacterium sedimenticola TaxID=3043286 RepID=A0ABT6XTV9_9FLAO|nr:glycosyltransferase family 39 protein [Flavobacterium sedimenticola]MDI9258534.1 glycosyltransferase family 39 protein [Flavobacterium sedimenticola]